MERITGPFNGFYIATRSSRTRGSESGFMALSKICRGKPDTFSGAYCCASVDAVRPFATEQEAINDAERRARAQTVELTAYAFAKPSRIEAPGEFA